MNKSLLSAARPKNAQFKAGTDKPSLEIPMSNRFSIGHLRLFSTGSPNIAPPPLHVNAAVEIPLVRCPFQADLLSLGRVKQRFVLRTSQNRTQALPPGRLWKFSSYCIVPYLGPSLECLSENFQIWDSSICKLILA